MRIPAATYRVQFNKDYRFSNALALVPQLKKLGISHLYASPVFAARQGSMHGYDVVDPNRVNPELGTPEEFEQLATALHDSGMGLILDIVPNHMAASPENVWWMDVLESGAASKYAGYFGIRWDAAGENVEEKIFLPILGTLYGNVLDAGELKLSYENGGFFVNYWEIRLPVAPAAYRQIIGPACEPLQEDPEIRLLLDILERIAPRITHDWDALERRESEKELIKGRIKQLYGNSPAFRESLDRTIERLNGNPTNPETFETLHEILENQAYRLAYWMVARDRINYRRFFDVSDLIGMRVESDEVFQASHALVLDLIRRGVIDGIRIDHIDGLYDPAGYLRKLPPDVYTIVEKILVGTERLPETWSIQGTTGYDFLGYMNALFVQGEGLERLSWFYREVIGFGQSLEDVEYERKRLAMKTLFPGEIADLGASLASLAEDDRYARDLSPADIGRALREITAWLPVYRTYSSESGISDTDRYYLAQATRQALERSEMALGDKVFRFAQRVLSLGFRPRMTDEQKAAWVRFVKRWQQISGPVMAKGVEDSTFYVYNRLVSLNEVGAIPWAVKPEQFHRFLAYRSRRWPAAMNATSTHDTKRSEDVRARLNVVAEIADEWIRHVTRWRRLTRGKRGPVDENEEYFIYQNLLGAWPLQAEEIPEFRERFSRYLIKAAREARVHTDWLKSSEEHELALTEFAGSLFENEAFQSSFQPLFEKVAWFGAINSLSQVLLKATAPGVPDFYRGTIGWDFSLVDPDNRRPVEFAPLTDLEEPAGNLFKDWRNGRVKIYLTEKTLLYRRQHPDIFTSGEYIPVTVRGKHADNVFSFLRRSESHWVLVVVPRFPARISSAVRPPLGMRVWHDTELVLPDEAPTRWNNRITGEDVRVRDRVFSVGRALAQFPVALLSGRSALHLDQ
jgi:(1->4)-alpha-D-glucan 1-alpha-D-glucosylmutase